MHRKTGTCWKLHLSLSLALRDPLIEPQLPVIPSQPVTVRGSESHLDFLGDAWLQALLLQIDLNAVSDSLVSEHVVVHDLDNQVEFVQRRDGERELLVELGVAGVHLVAGLGLGDDVIRNPALK